MADDHYEGGMPIIHNRRCTCEKCCPQVKKPKSSRERTPSAPPAAGEPTRGG